MNIKALERIVNQPIKRAEKWENCIFVVPKKGRPTFVSNKRMDKDFVNLRIKNSYEEMEVVKLGVRDQVSCWRVTSKSGNVYKVFIGLCDKTGRVHCTCKDFEKHDQGENRFLCKHIRKVLREGMYCTDDNDPLGELLKRVSMPGGEEEEE